MMTGEMVSAVRYGVVEDDAGFRNTLAEALAAFENLQCAGLWPDAESAFARIHTSLPEVLLVDLRLPGCGGVELIQRLQLAYPDILCIALTVVDKADVVLRALEAGAVGYLLKTAGPAEICSAIREVKSGGSAMTGTIARQVIQSFRPSHAGQRAVESLTTREAQILGLLAEGRIYKEIAGALGLSPATIRAHIRNIYKKLQVNSRTEAVRKSGFLTGWLRRH